MVIDLPGRTEPLQLHKFRNRSPSSSQGLDQAQPHGVPQSSQRVGRLGPVRTQHRLRGFGPFPLHKLTVQTDHRPGKDHSPSRYFLQALPKFRQCPVSFNRRGFGTWLRRGALHSLLKLGESPRNLGDLPNQRVPRRRKITHSASLSSDARTALAHRSEPAVRYEGRLGGPLCRQPVAGMSEEIRGDCSRVFFVPSAATATMTYHLSGEARRGHLNEEASPGTLNLLRE